MTRTRTGRPLPAALLEQADRCRQDGPSRREFLAQATSFGASAATAYALLGLDRPAHAEDATEGADATRAVTGSESGPKSGPEYGPGSGTVRIQMLVRDLRDPRSFDWFQAANFSRGWLEYLVSYENDGTFQPQLLSAWEISDDATQYTLHVRPGVQWNDGTPFTAADVARNIARWCERDVPGNSMAGRFAALVDPATGLAREGAIATPDDLTVTLTLPRPDISLIAGMADYPAAILPKGFDPETMFENPVGTGPYLPEMLEPGTRAVLVRNDAHAWWNAGNGAWIERIEFIDTGTDPVAAYAAAEAGLIDMTHSIEGSYIDVFGALPGWTGHAIRTAATVVVRANQLAEVDGARPYADVRVRRALQLAMDNAVLLELGYDNRGDVAQNTHVSPLHPEYTVPRDAVYDPTAARALMVQAGMLDFEHDLISIDDGWRRNTADAAAALMVDAGLQVRRTILPGPLYWEGWSTFAFSTTDWGHRPLAVQTYALAYRTGAAWNEFGWASPAFDALLERALATLDIGMRRDLVAQMQRMVQDEGVTVQPYWRRLYNHTRAELIGGAHHIAFEIRPATLRWAAS